MQFRVLGPLEVDAGDGPLPLGGPKQRVVLANLLVRANQVVPVDTLIEGVWGEEPPEKARNTLQTYVSNLRGAIGEGRLLGRSPGYVLLVRPTELDAISFDEAVREAQRTLPIDPNVAVSELEDALGLWRGPALADVAEQSSLRAEAARLDELRLEAQERRIEGLLASGSSGRAIGELEALLAHQSLREGLWGLLMLALYREGRQADALNSFQRAREILADELGIDPSPELTRLHERILKQDPALELRGEPLRGYRLLEKIDDGPHGVTFRAIQPHVGRDVAVKIFGERVANDPAFVRRFERDAQAIAGLEHPHIVPVYDYWREPGHAYLVSRYLRGGSLRALEDRGEQLDTGRAARAVEQIASALRFAHRQGISHGNLRSSNILFDAERNAYLGDFRIGSGPVDPAEDDAALMRLASGLLGTDARDRLAAIAEHEESPVPAGVPNPYKGLRPFTEIDAPDFFGRAELVQRLIARLNETGPHARFLAVVGPSGSGKSSAVRAGLVPAIREGASGAPDRWYVAEMFPGTHPIDELEAAFRRIAVRPVPRLRGLLDSSSRGPLDAAKLVTPAGAEVVLLVDQLEELFALTTDEREREHFLESLRVATADPESRIRVIVTLRADFFDRPLIYPRFGELLAARTEAVPPLTPDELEQAIRGPAERLGVHLEPGLVAAMIADVAHQPGALPLLQYALTELFERRAEASMTLDAYREIGGVAGALSARAEHLYATADVEGERTVRQVFLRLVTLGEGRQDTRRRVTRSELDGLDVDDAATDIVLDAFGRHRLLTFDREPTTREPTVEIAHEALLTTWPRLRIWIDDAREDLRHGRRLARAGAEWRASGKDPSFLMRGSRLEQVETWAGATDVAIGRDERAYLHASVEQRDREREQDARRREREIRTERRSRARLRGLVAVFAVAALVAASLTLIATNQSARAERQARIAAARGLAHAAVANVDVDPQRALLLAIESAERTRSVDGSVLPETEDALHRAILASRELLSLPDVGGTVDWSGGVFAAEGPPTSGTVELRDPDTGDEIRTIEAHDGEVTDLALSVGGQLLASTGADGFLRVWDTSTGDELLAIPGPGGADGASLSSHGGLAAASWASAPSGRVVIIDLRTGARVGRFGFASPVDTSFDPHGGRLAVADAVTQTIEVIDVQTGERLLSLPGDFEPVSVSWSPDGRYIAAGGVLDGRVWDAERGRLVGILEPTSGLIESVDWSPDSTQIVTGGNDGAVRTWELTEAGVVEVLKLPARTASGAFEAAFAPDGDRVIAGDGGSAFASSENAGLKIWDISDRGDAEWANLPSTGSYPGDAAFFGSGDRLVANAGDERLAIWQLDIGREDRRVGGLGDFPTRGGGIVWKIVVAPDDRHLLVTLHTVGFELDVPTRTRTRLFAGAVESDAHPDGEHIAIATTTGSVQVVDRAGGGPEVLDSEHEGVWGLDFSADGRLLAIAEPYLGHSRPRVTVWDVSSGQLITSIDTESETVDFSPDGTRVVTAARNGLPIVWDARTGARLATLASRSSGAVWDPVFSPDGSSVAIGTASGAVRLVDPETGLDQMMLRGSEGVFTRLAFSPDGSMLAAKTFGGEGTVRVWALDLRDLLEIAHSKLTRTWTDDECRQYLRVGACPPASA